jgi:asparagine synthase (glutamine-hydrolysing)
MDEIVSAVDEPISDPAVIPLFILAEFAAKQVKVCLTGDGGDELFGGYQYHRLRRVKALVHDGSAVGAMLRGSLDVLRRVATVPGIGARRLRAVAELALEPNIAPAIATASWLPRPFNVSMSAKDRAVDWSDPDGVLEASMRGPLAGAMLPKTDRITMKHSLEARVPFLDDRVIALARGLPWPAKVHRGQTKYVLRRALMERAPSELCSRSKKGFRVPLDQWFRGELSFWLRARIGSGSAVEAVFGAGVCTLLEQHAAQTADNGQMLWALSILEQWLRRVDARVG